MDIDIFSPICKMGVLVLPCVVLTLFVTPVLWMVFPHIVALGLAGLIGGGAFTLLCWAFRLIDLTSVWVKLKPKAKSANKN